MSKVNAFNTGIWNLLKTALLDTTNKTCGKTKKRHHRRVTWWWNDEVNLAIVEKTVLESMEAGRQQRTITTGQTKCKTYSLHSKEDC